MGNKTSKKEKKDIPKEPEVKQQEVVSNAPSKSTQQPRVVIEGSSPKPSRQLDSGEKSKPKRIVENTELNAEEIIESIPPEILEYSPLFVIEIERKVKGKKVIHIAVLASATIQGTSKMQQFPKGGVSVEGFPLPISHCRGSRMDRDGEWCRFCSHVPL
eukprot:TRINITY_DN2679_c0_g1_i6.p1 TRINITY_DN2679_c0_g1~~TRINITY_DN2679_c0_g1_i6.p1  ORF type:complete len:159 (+),score=35.11 TRINITY_DN2679_c0_g1_i6:64-540(+)